MVGPLVTPKQIEKTTSSQSVASDFIGFNLFGMVISKSVLNRPAANLSPAVLDGFHAGAVGQCRQQFPHGGGLIRVGPQGASRWRRLCPAEIGKVI
jgi:hypothetical protein